MSAPDPEATLAGQLLRSSRKRRRRVLDAVIRRDGPYCFWCGTLTDMAFRKLLRTATRPGSGDGRRRRQAPTLDHIVPVTAGGPDTVENGLCACYSCNARRGDTDASVFLFSILVKAPCRGSPDASRAARHHRSTKIDNPAGLGVG